VGDVRIEAFFFFLEKWPFPELLRPLCGLYFLRNLRFAIECSPCNRHLYPGRLIPSEKSSPFLRRRVCCGCSRIHLPFFLGRFSELFPFLARPSNRNVMRWPAPQKLFFAFEFVFLEPHLLEFHLFYLPPNLESFPLGIESLRWRN